MTWAVLGDSTTGTSHHARGVPCQDAFRVHTFGPAADWLVLAVADGAGSATHADIGAGTACAEFVRRVSELDPAGLFTRAGMVELFAGVRDALLAEAAARDVRPRELACTALLAVVGPDAAAFAQLGDGAIVLGPDYRAVFWPEETGEYANVTDFLTDARFADVVRVDTTAGRVTELALLTDGLQRLALDFTTRAPHPEFFRPLFHRLRREPDPGSLLGPFRSFLDSPRVNNRTDDDKTLVLAVRPDAHDTTPSA